MDQKTIFKSALDMSSTSVGLALVTLSVSMIYFFFKRRNLPPGPTGLPFLGYWPFLDDKTCHLQLDEMKKKYGDVFSINITGQLYINLGSIKAVREAHINKSECFAGRSPTFSMFQQLFKDGVAFCNGEPWRILRKFFLPLVKERGVTALNSSLSGSLQESIQSVVDDLRAMKGKPVNLIELLTYKSITILRLTLFGEVGVPEEKLRHFNDLYAAEVANLSITNMLLMGPIAEYLIVPFKSDAREILKYNKKVGKCLLDIIEEHKKSYDEENIRDIIDEFFKERDKRRSKGDATAKYFTDKCLADSLHQFLGDGALTVGSLTVFLLKLLVQYPEEQDKIYKEIVEVVGVDRLPTMDDKSKLTYFNAFLLEALRVSDFFPVFASLLCTKETTLNGYRIPEGAVTIINFYSAHSDPETFEEPHKFDPTRYIQKEGKKRPELPITFGVGKRNCLGEGFAMTQVFLFLAALVQNFHLNLPDDKQSSFEQYMTSTVFVCAKPRN